MSEESMPLQSGNLLYKYLAVERISVLTNLMVRFTQLHELNDPYEGRFILEPLEREREAALADGFRAEWAQVEVFISTTMAALGVLCLARHPDNEVMWAHYASNHQGFVMGIRPELEPFRGPAFIWGEYGSKIDLTHIPGFGSFRGVEYPPEPYRISFGAEPPLDACFSKTPKWQHEAEVRIFCSIYDATLVLKPSVHLFAIPPKAIARVIVGAKAAPEVVEAAVAIGQRSEFLSLNIERAVFDQRSMRMAFRPLEETVPPNPTAPADQKAPLSGR